MVNCCVPYCKSQSYKITLEKISFHKFPKDETMRSKWVNAIRRCSEDGKTLWNPSAESRVCSKHFRDSDFSISTIRQKLLPYSVPSMILRDVSDSCQSRSNNKRFLLVDESPGEKVADDIFYPDELEVCIQQEDEPYDSFFFTTRALTSDHDYYATVWKEDKAVQVDVPIIKQENYKSIQKKHYQAVFRLRKEKDLIIKKLKKRISELEMELRIAKM